MAIVPYLAMTATEMGKFSTFPKKTAWMACHFSPYGLGLSNLPRWLPAGSLLMLDDVTPPNGHDPEYIARQLADCLETFTCHGILLDFQRAGSEEIRSIAEYLTNALPCPVILSEAYGENLNCPVFLSPVPPSVSMQAHCAPWRDRDIWLELGLEGERIILTEEGCTTYPILHPDVNASGFSDINLHCHYSIETNKKSACFTLWRTMEDLKDLMEDAEQSGIVGVAGLYQEIGTWPHAFE